MRSISIFFLVVIFFVSTCSYSQKTKINVNYVDVFENANHPQIAYWFFSKDMLNEKSYKSKIDSLVQFSKFTLIFLTARNGVDFYNNAVMHPIFQDLVSYAHQKGLKIALQLWERRYKVPIENTERLMQQTEILLDKKGDGAISIKPKGAIEMDLLFKNEIFNVYAFKKTGDGFYDASTLQNITTQCKAVDNNTEIAVNITTNESLRGYTALILTQHYYNYCSNHSKEAADNLDHILKVYSDISFDGVGLDEYTNLHVTPIWDLIKDNELFRAIPFSLAMADAYKKRYGFDLPATLFDMLYAPQSKPEVRIKAINTYMSIEREGTMNIEKIIYNSGKTYYGKNSFIGLHDTHHNTLDGDEVWQTGINWWNIKRDYGHTDEHTPTPTQIGIGFCYPENILYNMFYSKQLNEITEKSLTDLRYGIRTGYHAINDIQGWGVSVENPFALDQINKVENAARLLNQFNPSFPAIKLLIVFGMESQLNWYPDTASRNICNINGSLDIETKAKLLWDEGYRNVLVPTDVIEDGRLFINANGKPELGNHVFDAIVFLYPQYSTISTLQFFENYLAKEGKLMTEGNASKDFFGNDISARWKKILNKATVPHFSVDNICKLGIKKNTITNGSLNEDGSYTFTNLEALKNNSAGIFSFTLGGNVFSGSYTEMAAIKINWKGNVEKLAATGFSYLKKNGKIIMRLSTPADIFFEAKETGTITIADKSKTIQPTFKYFKK